MSDTHESQGADDDNPNKHNQSKNKRGELTDSPVRDMAVILNIQRRNIFWW